MAVDSVLEREVLVNHPLVSKGFVTLECPSGLFDQLPRIVSSWQGFCSLSTATKQAFSYPDISADLAGYEIKKNKGKTQDAKEKFHFCLAHVGRFVDTHGEDPIAQKFINDACVLDSWIKDVLQKVVLSMGEVCHLPDLWEEILSGRDQWVTRYLHYLGTDESQDHLAAAHIDTCGITLYFYTSAPGLLYLNRRKKWKALNVLKGKIVATPNLQMQYRSKGSLQALWHQVEPTKETIKTGRFAIVSFIPFVRTPKRNDELYSRTQEMESGFNYNMPHEEFAKFFV